MKKISNDEFLRKIKDHKLCIVPLEEYRGSSIPIKFQCNNCNLIFEKIPRTLLQKGAGCGCPQCTSKNKHDKLAYSNEQYKALLFEKTTSIELIGDYDKGTKKALFHCLKCNHVWQKSPTQLLFKPYCPKCHKEERLKRLTKTHEQFCEELQEIFPRIIPLEEYKNNATKIKFKCEDCGCEWYKSPRSFNLKGKPKGCLICRGRLLKTQEQFIEQIKERNPYVTIIGKYINDITKIEYKCNICNLTHFATPSSLIQGSGCPICKASKGEKKIREILDSFRIEYCVQKEFPDLLGLGLGHLSYDFYLQKYNLLIEYQGKQHYEPVRFFGSSDINEFEVFEKQKIHDDRKKQYAIERNIDLLIIPYWDFDNIESIIKNKILLE